MSTLTCAVHPRVAQDCHVAAKVKSLDRFDYCRIAQNALSASHDLESATISAKLIGRSRTSLPIVRTMLTIRRPMNRDFLAGIQTDQALPHDALVVSTPDDIDASRDERSLRLRDASCFSIQVRE